MFDHYHARALQVNAHTTVTEKRAPTDEAIRILREMEKSSAEQVLKAQKLDNNLISATIWETRDPLEWKQKYKIIAKINGKNIDIDVSTDPNVSSDEVKRLIFETVAERLAVELLNTSKNQGGSL